MKGEIVQQQVGACGNQIGALFWEDLCWEHGILPTGVYHGDSDRQLEHINVHFSENGGIYRPRAILIDSDPSGLLWAYPPQENYTLYQPQMLVSRTSSCEGNWAKGYHTIGSTMIEETLEATRKQIEACSSLSGFQMIHSLGGGTGSGFGSSLLRRVREEFPKQILSTASIISTEEWEDSPYKTINTVLSVKHLTETCDHCLLFDNNGIDKNYFGVYRMRARNYAPRNAWISAVLCGMTSPFRLADGPVCADLRRLSQNLVPYPGLPFLTASLAPLVDKGEIVYRALTYPELLHQAFNPRNNTGGINPTEGIYLAACCVARGRNSYCELSKGWNEAWEKIVEVNSFALPDNVLTFPVDMPPRGLKTSMILLSNNTAIKETWSRLHTKYREHFSKRHLLHKYEENGVNELEFCEAEQCLVDLIEEYQQTENEPLAVEEVKVELPTGEKKGWGK